MKRLFQKISRIASYLNDGKNALFPDGVNVSFVEILSEDEIFVRTYERGVGYTNACGTAMSASSLMYVLEKTDGKGFEKTLSVKNPGGMVKTIVHRKEDGNYFMSLIGNGTLSQNARFHWMKRFLAIFRPQLGKKQASRQAMRNLSRKFANSFWRNQNEF